MTRVLVLGGTTEATALARSLADARIPAIFSYAGRTAEPTRQPLETRVGGFGGAQGLAAYLRRENISHVVDATHPFAATMSLNAIAACAETATPLLALERPPWTRGAGDNWFMAADIETAVAALPDAPARVFLAIGRQNLQAFGAKPQHSYLLRVVDPLSPEAASALPFRDVAIVVDKGPFSEAGDTELLVKHGITHLVAKNSGGAGASAKLAAARALSLPVIMIERPALPMRNTVSSVDEVMDWLSHTANLGV